MLTMILMCIRHQTICLLLLVLQTRLMLRGVTSRGRHALLTAKWTGLLMSHEARLRSRQGDGLSKSLW